MLPTSLAYEYYRDIRYGYVPFANKIYYLEHLMLVAMVEHW